MEIVLAKNLKEGDVFYKTRRKNAKKHIVSIVEKIEGPLWSTAPLDQRNKIFIMGNFGGKPCKQMIANPNCEFLIESKN